MYCGVPRLNPVCVMRCPPAACTASAMPKSATRVASSSSIWRGLRVAAENTATASAEAYSVEPEEPEAESQDDEGPEEVIDTDEAPAADSPAAGLDISSAQAGALTGEPVALPTAA